MIRLLSLLCLASAVSLADTWFGTLVDTGCYEAAERNVNPRDTLTAVDRDINSELQRCAPTAKTKAFTVVQPEGTSVRLDSAGNAKAADLASKQGKNARLYVTVTGALVKNTVQVDSIEESGAR
jgi:hypothetical protein